MMRLAAGLLMLFMGMVAAKGMDSLVLLQHEQQVSSVSYLPDGKQVITGCGNGHVYLWNAKTGQQTQEIDTHGGVESVAVSPNGTQLVTTTVNVARVWDIKTSHELFTLRGHTVHISSVAYTPDGKHIVTSGGEGAIRVWDAQTGKQTLLINVKNYAVFGVAVSSDSKRVVAALNDSTAKVWDIATGEMQFTLTGHQGGVGAVAWS